MKNIRPEYTELVLAENGIATCSVVISAQANEKVRTAAADFADLFNKMCGAVIPILEDRLPVTGACVLIGDSCYTREAGIAPFTSADPETIILKRSGNTLLLLGNDEDLFTGTQFAVTMFFERLGCGWYGPDELWQVIPTKKDIRIDYLDIEHHPQFVSRRNNVLNFFPELGKRWYLGGEHRTSGHALTSLVPRETYFGEHPEWFCMVDGKRNPFVEWWQYCYSNEELVDLFAEKICAIFEQKPSIKQFSIAANDGWYHGFCECPECRKLGSTTDQVMSFANRLARKIGVRFPNHRLTVLAYFPTYRPPTKPLRMEPNVEIMFCKETDMFSPVDKGPDTGYHEKYLFPESKNTYPTPWKTNFENWLSIVQPEHICIWDWYCIAAAKPEWKDVPWVQGDVATRNIRYWHDHGVEYVYTDQGPLDVFYEDGTSFPLRWPLWLVSAKSWWDKDLTGSDILMDACKKLYGSAADVMAAVYRCLADIAQDCHAKSIAWHPPKPSEMYTPETIRRVDALMKIAKEFMSVEDSLVARRLQIQIDLWDKAKQVIALN